MKKREQPLTLFYALVQGIHDKASAFIIDGTLFDHCHIAGNISAGDLAA